MTPWSTPDLSDITQVVLGLVQYAIGHSQPPITNVNVSAVSPETARRDNSLCQLTLYLLHVGRDPYWRNTPVGGPRPQLNTAQPLSLNLSYLLTAWHDTDFNTEQRAMSIALQAIHSQPIVDRTVIQNNGLQQWLPNGEFTMSIEADTIEEMSRLWQAFTVPIRLSALIRVGVVFIAPAAATPAPHLPPTVANLSIGPSPAAAVTTPLLFGGTGQNFPPVLADTDPALVTATNGPSVAVGGSSLSIAGYGLDPSVAADVFLAVPGTGTEWTVTPWRQASTQPDRLDLVLPAAYANAASASATPLPGIYNLTLSAVTPPGSRSNSIPLAIAPRVNVTVPPLLTPDNTGLYSISGAGFVPAATVVALGAIPLTAAAAPGPGQFAVNAAGNAITFMLPNPKPPTGSYPVLIQINGITAEPGWIVVVS
jgi:hypothetical protein